MSAETRELSRNIIDFCINPTVLRVLYLFLLQGIFSTCFAFGSPCILIACFYCHLVRTVNKAFRHPFSTLTLTFKMPEMVPKMSSLNIILSRTITKHVPITTNIKFWETL